MEIARIFLQRRLSIETDPTDGACQEKMPFLNQQLNSAMWRRVDQRMESVDMRGFRLFFTNLIGRNCRCRI